MKNALPSENSNNIFEKALSFLKPLFHKETKQLKESIEKEVADVAFEDFKNSLLNKKSVDAQGNSKQFYSAQLLGSVNFFGDTLLKPILEYEYKNDLSGSFLKSIKEFAMDSLLSSRVSKEEKDEFWSDFEQYRTHVRENIQTKEDLQKLKDKNVQLTQDYDILVNTQLEEELQQQISTDRQQHIQQQPTQNRARAGESIAAASRIGTIPKSTPKSAPFEKSPTGTTLCSRTAWKNGQSFGINLPRGNAKDAVSAAPISRDFTSSIKDTQKLKAGNFSQLDPQANFVDLSVVSHTSTGQKYGHRAIAYLNQSDKQRYVLDPYTGANFGIKKDKPESPIPLAQYQAKRPLLQANFYKSEYYVV
jgi:hypothetical protein